MNKDRVPSKIALGNATPSKLGSLLVAGQGSEYNGDILSHKER